MGSKVRWFWGTLSTTVLTCVVWNRDRRSNHFKNLCALHWSTAYILRPDFVSPSLRQQYSFLEIQMLGQSGGGGVSSPTVQGKQRSRIKRLHRTATRSNFPSIELDAHNADFVLHNRVSDCERWPNHYVNTKIRTSLTEGQKRHIRIYSSLGSSTRDI
jgi:hypothetical protein